MNLWNQLKEVPQWAQKKIPAGRLKGMTDIKPQWRYQRLTEVFGPCGEGWRFDILKMWTEAGSDGQIAVFAHVLLWVKRDDTWSDLIPGIGGSMFIAKEKSGLHTSDEAFKMAVTDALGTAAKMLGLAADVYMGHGGKYTQPAKQPDRSPAKVDPLEAEKKKLQELLKGKKLTDRAQVQFVNYYLGAIGENALTSQNIGKVIKDFENVLTNYFEDNRAAT